MRRSYPALSFTLALLMAGCGIPTDESPIAFVPAEPTPIAQPTATPVPGDTQLFPIYLIDNEGRVQQALRSLPETLTITALVTELTEDPTDEEQELNLVSLFPAESEFFSRPFSADGIAELDFASGTSVDTLEGELRNGALAQLVWTLTGSPSIDEVIIRIDGEDQSWPTDEVDKADPLSRDDYASFDPEFVEPTPTPDDEVPSEEGDPPSEEEPPSEGGPPAEETPTPEPPTEGG